MGLVVTGRDIKPQSTKELIWKEVEFQCPADTSASGQLHS